MDRNTQTDGVNKETDRQTGRKADRDTERVKGGG